MNMSRVYYVKIMTTTKTHMKVAQCCKLDSLSSVACTVNLQCGYCVTQHGP